MTLNDFVFTSPQKCTLAHILAVLVIYIQNQSADSEIKTKAGCLWYDDVAVPWLNDRHSMNGTGFLSSGKIPSAKGYEALRVRRLVIWKSKPLLHFYRIFNAARKSNLLTINFQFKKNVSFKFVHDIDNNAYFTGFT